VVLEHQSYIKITKITIIFINDDNILTNAFYSLKTLHVPYTKEYPKTSGQENCWWNFKLEFFLCVQTSQNQQPQKKTFWKI